MTLAWWLSFALNAAGEPAHHRYAIVIGSNSAFSAPGDEVLAPLHFADDDAAAMYEFFSPVASVELLSLLDERSQRRFPEVAAVALPPTWNELLQAVGRVAEHLRADHLAGVRSTVWLFFSGHGSVDKSATAYLALADAKLTQQRLYDEIIAALPANEINIFVDACHAEAVVRSRGSAEAQSVAVSASEAADFLAARSLKQFPQVGAVIATTFAEKAHEWDVYGQGVFTHQLLSALRGGADVNHDGVVEYSELHAFLAAANREVSDDRAKLAVLVSPPPLHLRAALIDRHWWAAPAVLEGPFDSLGHFFVENDRGVRLLDAHFESGADASVLVPEHEHLFIRSALGEAEFAVPSGQHLSARRLSWRMEAVAARGALASSLARGLFTAAYGPIYYRGFVDHAGETSVDFTDPPTPMGAPNRPIHDTGVGLLISAAIGGAGSLVLGGFALDALHTYNSTPWQLASQGAAARYRQFGETALVAASISAAEAILGAVLLTRSDRPMATMELNQSKTLVFGMSGKF